MKITPSSKRITRECRDMQPSDGDLPFSCFDVGDHYGGVWSFLELEQNRRLVACVNACDGISTEDLESLTNDLSDGALFRFWIAEASRNPGRVAAALANCLTPDDYRAALHQLRESRE